MRNSTRSVLAGAAAVAVALSAAVTAHGEPTTPQARIPDLQGPACDPLKKEIGADVNPQVYRTLSEQSASQVIAAIPSLSTFSSAISGGLNPGVNIVGVLDNGPYTIFAPTNEAFAKLDPAVVEQLKADPAALYDVVYYHAVLSLLGVNDVSGKLTTQQGAQVTIVGKGGDITADGAKVLCGAVNGRDSRIYLLDTVLDPAKALPPNATTAPTTTSSTETTSPTAPSPTSAPPTAPSSPEATPTTAVTSAPPR